MPMSFANKRVEYPHQIEEIRRLRVQVWNSREILPEAAEIGGVWWDGNDEGAEHRVAQVDDQVVGDVRPHIVHGPTAMHYAEECADVHLDRLGPVGLVMRLVIDSCFGGGRFARALDLARIQRSSERGVLRVLVDATSERVGSLKLLGFEQLGSRTAESGQSSIGNAPGYWMDLKLNGPKTSPASGKDLTRQVEGLDAT